MPRRNDEGVRGGREETQIAGLGAIVDLGRLQRIADHLYAAGGIPVGIIDLEHNILVGAGWQEICTRFHRAHPEARKRCLESDATIRAHLDSPGVYAYKCRNMLWDLALPVKIRGRHLATIFVGQFFYVDEPIDYAAFRRQAEEYGFDWEEYRAALDAVPVFSRERVKHMMEYWRLLVELLADAGLAALDSRSGP